MFLDKLDSLKNKLNISLFGKYSSGNKNLSTTYKQKLKDKINKKYLNKTNKGILC